METVPELLAETREREGDAFRAPERAAPVSTAEAVASAWQMGNLVRHYGVRPGERVAVVAGPTTPNQTADPGQVGAGPVAVLSVLGALVAGGVLDLDPPRAVDATVLVAPAAWLDRYEPGPGTTALAYGSEPEPADVVHLEREAWSENSTPPPATLHPTTDAVADDRVYAHGDLLALARGVALEETLEAADGVALAAPLTGVRTLIAGVLAPLVAGVPIALGDPDATVAVATGETAAERRIDPATVGEET